MTTCPVCNSSKRYKITEELNSCCFCGTTYLRNRLSTKDHQKFLEENALKKIKNSTNKDVKELLYLRLILLLKYIASDAVFLDIGPGDGLFLTIASSLGLNITGMDKSRLINRYLKENQFKTCSSFKNINTNSIDCITLFDVLEHTLNPKYFLKQIYSKLSKGGILMITTPNQMGLSGRLINNKFWRINSKEHLFILNKQTLQKLLLDSNFSILHLETNMIHWWQASDNKIINKIINKLIFFITLPFQKLLFRMGLGDNLQVIARKITVMNSL